MDLTPGDPKTTVFGVELRGLVSWVSIPGGNPNRCQRVRSAGLSEHMPCSFKTLGVAETGGKVQRPD